VFRSVVAEIVRDSEEVEKLFTLGANLGARQPKGGEITLEEVGKMKIICDAYFIRTLNEMAKRRSGENTSESAPAPDSKDEADAQNGTAE
jgi:hypothetical protein